MKERAAGRELDARIAVELFGWVWLRHSVKVQQLPKTDGKWSTEWRRSLFIPNHEVKPFETPEGTQNVPANGDERIHIMNAPPYSTDWSSAALVIDKMRERKMAFAFGANGHASQFSAWFFDGIWALGRQQNVVPAHGDPHLYGVASASIGPRAICLAALAAVEATK